MQVFNECIDDNALIEKPVEDPVVPSEKQVVEDGKIYKNTLPHKG
jgi:hypothetical protein